MNSAATIEGTPASTSTMKVVTRTSRPEPYSTKNTAVIKPSGTDRMLATPACTNVPYTAWYTPPANSSGSTPRSEWVHQPDRVTAYQPRARTTDSTQISGTSATRNEPRKHTVAALLVIRRRQPSDLNASVLTGRSRASTVMGAAPGHRCALHRP